MDGIQQNVCARYTPLYALAFDRRERLVVAAFFERLSACAACPRELGAHLHRELTCRDVRGEQDEQASGLVFDDGGTPDFAACREREHALLAVRCVELQAASRHFHDRASLNRGAVARHFVGHARDVGVG